VVSYDLRVELEAHDSVLRPGMTAIADIAVARREDTLVVPNRAIRRDTQGRYYVDVATASGIEQRTVSIGVSNEQYTEVASGLREGEQVVVSVPTRSLLEQFGGGAFGFGGTGQ
jgi:multidrug efflux pump subunit AcrA (membrane-fusion protein)